MIHTPVRNNHTANKILSARRETFSFFIRKCVATQSPETSTASAKTTAMRDIILAADS